MTQARKDGYHDFDPSVFTKDSGFLYSYSGLRGNAKTLYKSVVSGKENRIQLVKAPTSKEQEKYVQDADLVIWACGYQTNKIPIKNQEGKEITLSQSIPFTQMDVDAKCRVKTEDKQCLLKVFGSGIAYPIRTSDGMMSRDGTAPYPRADSFSLYCNFVANRILQQLFSANYLSSKLHKASATVSSNQKKLTRPSREEKSRTKFKPSEFKAATCALIPEGVKPQNSKQTFLRNVTKLLEPVQTSKKVRPRNLVPIAAKHSQSTMKMNESFFEPSKSHQQSKQAYVDNLVVLDDHQPKKKLYTPQKNDRKARVADLVKAKGVKLDKIEKSKSYIEKEIIQQLKLAKKRTIKHEAEKKGPRLGDTSVLDKTQQNIYLGVHSPIWETEKKKILPSTIFRKCIKSDTLVTLQNKESAPAGFSRRKSVKQQSKPISNKEYVKQALHETDKRRQQEYFHHISKQRLKTDTRQTISPLRPSKATPTLAAARSNRKLGTQSKASLRSKRSESEVSDIVMEFGQINLYSKTMVIVKNDSQQRPLRDRMEAIEIKDPAPVLSNNFVASKQLQHDQQRSGSFLIHKQ